jgi:radical SAM superfamily enzyme YgiQ (UPF0313 family)
MPPQQGLLAGFATGLLYLRRHLQIARPEQPVEIIDLSLVEDDLIEDNLSGLSGADAIVFGITTTTATYQAALKVAHKVKKLYGRRAVVLFGGHHASADAKVILDSHPGVVDFIIRGEGEIALQHFLDTWPNVEETPNLVHRNASGELRFVPEAPLLDGAALDKLTLDARWFIEQGHPGKFDHFTYVSARGCPLKCKFCAVANQAIRGKSPDTIADEIRAIVQQGFDRIAIEDNFFAHTSVRTRAVCSALKQLREDGVRFTWDCQTRVESAARVGTAELLAESGCEAVYLGVEALTPAALRFLGKTAAPDRYVETLCSTVVPNLLAAELGVYLNLQFGLPQDTNDFEGAAPILRRIAAHALAHGAAVTIFPQLFVVYPGTAHFAELTASGILWPTAAEDFTDWEQHESALTDWISRYFAHGVGGIPLGVLNMKELEKRRFELDTTRTLLVQSALAAVEAIPGLAVFKYTNYLAPIPNELAAPAAGPLSPLQSLPMSSSMH